MLCNKNDDFLLVCTAIFVKCISIPASHCHKYSYIEFNTAETGHPSRYFHPFLILPRFSPIPMSSHFTAFQVRALTEPSKSQSSSMADRIDRIYSAANLVAARTEIRLFSRSDARARLYILSSISFCKISLIVEDRDRKRERFARNLPAALRLTHRAVTAGSEVAIR